MIDTLAELFAMRAVPRAILSDNGPEFIAQSIRRWLKQVGVEALYIEPGSPWESGYAESFQAACVTSSCPWRSSTAWGQLGS